MGKRKKSGRKPTGPKKKEPLATTFQCLFCNHEKSVIVKLEKKAGIGLLNCKMCGQSFQSGINYLSAAIDVYSDWIDACDAVAGGEAPESVGIMPKNSYREIDAPSRGEGASRKEPGLGDDFIEDDEDDDMAAGYADE